MKTYRFEVERYIKETIDVIADNEKDARQILEWAEGDPPHEPKAYFGGVSEPRKSRSRILRKVEERPDNQFGY